MVNNDVILKAQQGVYLCRAYGPFTARLAIFGSHAVAHTELNRVASSKAFECSHGFISSGWLNSSRCVPAEAHDVGLNGDWLHAFRACLISLPAQGRFSVEARMFRAHAYQELTINAHDAAAR